jgi:UDP-N-acetyl-2-amino-2-deoxyglucuronate dehydrogenase
VTFALLGAGGFVAPRHMKAIAALGLQVVAACDPSDSVGVLDRYFPDCHFFTEFERLDRHLDKLRRAGEPVAHLTVCSPNYLHDAHVRFGLRSGADVICEKPLVLNPWNLDALASIEAETGKSVFTILQLRHHPVIQALRERVISSGRADYEVDLTYITARGRWYHASWKGDEAKSGGVATNIGVHFFDMLSNVFGKMQASDLHLRDASRMSGVMEFERARVSWFLSVDAHDLPEHLDPSQRTFRSISMDEEQIEFSEGFTDLHTVSYEEVIAGRGFGIDDVRPSIEIVAQLRTAALKHPGPAAHRLALRHL